jgi:hypothetical protein
MRHVEVVFESGLRMRKPTNTHSVGRVGGRYRHGRRDRHWCCRPIRHQLWCYGCQQHSSPNSRFTQRGWWFCAWPVNLSQVPTGSCLPVLRPYIHASDVSDHRPWALQQRSHVADSRDASCGDLEDDSVLLLRQWTGIYSCLWAVYHNNCS